MRRKISALFETSYLKLAEADKKFYTLTTLIAKVLRDCVGISCLVELVRIATCLRQGAILTSSKHEKYKKRDKI